MRERQHICDGCKEAYSRMDRLIHQQYVVVALPDGSDGGFCTVHCAIRWLAESLPTNDPMRKQLAAAEQSR